MKNWFRPENLAEALEIRSRETVVPMAGATDLYVRNRRGGGLPPQLDRPILYIGHLEELRNIEVSEREIRLGAAVTYTDLMEHPEVPALLRSAVGELAAPALRNVGTLGGNICNASPAADAVCPLYALDALCEVRSAGGSRELPVEELITAPGRTVIRENELLTCVRIPRRGEGVWFYKKVGTRRANALSKLSLAARATLVAGKLEEVAIALGAVGPRVLRSKEIEGRMTGPLHALETQLQDILASYRELVTPIDDQRSTAAYREEVAVNLVRQFITERL
ncbi:MAG: FAD binding domain-containing protein, partial [Alkalispirochaetaceae bacterium]